MTTTPEPLTLHPTPATPTDPGPWTYEMVDMAFEAVPGSQVRRCPCCYAAGEDTYYLDPWGDTHCAACIATCPYCYEAPAVVSARRTADDPGRPGLVDHVCLGCLEEHWAPGATLLLPGPAKAPGSAETDRRVA